MKNLATIAQSIALLSPILINIGLFAIAIIGVVTGHVEAIVALCMLQPSPYMIGSPAMMDEGGPYDGDGLFTHSDDTQLH